MDEELAIKQLKVLVKTSGSLKIITNEPRTDKEANADLRSVNHWVLHDVIIIDGPDDRGRMTAHSKEGDWCMGFPIPLLRRLTEWQSG
jgi:hypothetical protein